MLIQSNKRLKIEKDSFKVLRDKIIANRELQAISYGDKKLAAEEEGARLLALQIEYVKERDAMEVTIAKNKIHLLCVKRISSVLF